MRIKQGFILLLLLVLCCKVNAQISLVDAPKPGAFLAQDPTTGEATLEFSGTLTDPTYSALNIKIYKANTLYRNTLFNLKFVNNLAKFSFKTDLPAGKHMFTIKLELRGNDTLYKEIGGILVGDVYIIQGQSNAVANSYSAYDNNYLDTFLRSFGTSSTNGNNTVADLNWHPINPSLVYRSGSVGQWAGVMAKQLLDSFGIPICLINGAVGGTRITQHQPTTNNHYNTSTIYGRLLYRVNAANLRNKIRGILYFQGESDGANAALHNDLFRKLVKYWKGDFPGFKKLYVIQVRQGCGGPSIQLRDIQRKFQDMANTQVVSANGLNGHDGCHYKFKNGYEDLGIQMAAILGRDFYNSKRKNVDPPNISKCYFSNSKETEITLEMMNPSDSVFVDPNFQSLFRVEGDPSVIITDGFLRDNKVVLTLNRSSCSKLGLTYDGLRWSQPWVKNATKMGLISFYNIPIERKPIQRTYQMCKNDSVTLQVDSVSGCSYLWKRNLTQMFIWGSKVSHKSNINETYTLYTTYDNSVCKPKDTLLILSIVDPAALPRLNKDTVLCQGDSLILQPNFDNYNSFTWYDKDTSFKAEQFVAYKKTPIRIMARSKMGCTYLDSMNIGISDPKIELPKDIKLCIGKDTLITVPNIFKSYTWNNAINGNNTYLSKKGLLTISVEDLYQCSASDTAFIKEHPSVFTSFRDKSICASTSISIPKPKHILHWKKASLNLMDSLELYPNSTISIELTDSNYCNYYDTINVTSLPLPTFSLGKDTGFCENTALVLSVPKGDYTYYWEDQISKSNQKLVNKEGHYNAKLINNQTQCTYSDTIKIVEYKLPSLSMFKDTILCLDSTWRVFVPTGVIYRLNGAIIKGAAFFNKPRIHYLTAESMESCKANKSIKVDYRDCFLGLPPISINNKVQVYPNPSLTGEFHIKQYSNYNNAIVYDLNGKKLCQLPLQNGDNKIDLTTFSDGTYFIHIGEWTYKMLKQSK